MIRLILVIVPIGDVSFLGAHGFHAAVILNYAVWKKREPVNGYIFVAPTLLNYGSLMKNDTQFVNLENVRKLVDLNEKCIFCPNWTNITSRFMKLPEETTMIESIRFSVRILSCL